MTAPGVLLQLTDGPAIEAWLASLAAAPGRHWLELIGHDRDDIEELCQRHGVDPDAPEGLVTRVIANGADVPAPSLVSRLVAALDEAEVVAARTVPLDGSIRCLAARSDVVADLEHVVGVPLQPTAVVFHDPSPAIVTSPDGSPPGTGHPAALPATSLATLLAAVGVDAGWKPVHHEGPFLSVITRTRGTRPQLLEETLLCLAAQTSRDFELVLACHRISPVGFEHVRTLVRQQPSWLRDRTRVLTVDRLGRSAPLNDALEVARGRYAAVLDDDDTVMASWVATFAALERTDTGRVLRSLALRQEVTRELAETPDGPVAYPAAQGPPQKVWPDRFSLIDHLHGNYSPCMTLAFPRGVFGYLGKRYNEALDTTEDWDYLVRAASLVGVVDSGTVTAVYRWWSEGDSSRHEHDRDRWEEHHRAVQNGFAGEVLVLPPGAAREVLELHGQLQRAREDLDQARGEVSNLRESLAHALVAHEEAVRAHDGAVRAHDEAVAAHDRAIEAVHAREAQLAKARANVARLRDRLRGLRAND